MQPVLNNGKPLAKGPRAMRAYLHREHAGGFRGRPVYVDRKKEERDPTHFHLSRYAYVETAMKKPLEIFCGVECREDGKAKFVSKGISARKLTRVRKLLEHIRENRENEGVLYPNEDPIVKEALLAFPYLNDGVFAQIQTFCQQAMDTFLAKLPDYALYWSKPERFKQFMGEARQDGSPKIVCVRLYNIVQEMLKEKKKGLNLVDRLPPWFYKFGHYYTYLMETPVWGERPTGRHSMSEAYRDEKEIIRDVMALYILRGVFYAKAVWQLSYVQTVRQLGMAGDSNRVKFTQPETEAWRYVRKHLFNGLDERVVLQALRFARFRYRYGRHDPNKIRKFLELHEKYALRQSFEVNGWKFRLEASPFAEKPIGNPIGRFAIVVYPEDPRFIRWLQRVNDPTFEHSDGALAVARVTITNGRILLEEIQSDMETMLKRGASVAIRNGKIDPEETRASIGRMLKIDLNGYDEKLKPLADKWKDIAMEALRIFARAHGFKEFYVATPYRVLYRYQGAMHPDKVRLYFDGWEKRAGEPVYDDKCELDRLPQYYYRFPIEAKI